MANAGEMLRLKRLLYVGLGTALLLCLWMALPPRACACGAETTVRDPNAACASCHREIYERYKKTPMAHASGPAAEGFYAADFVHGASGVHYRLTEDAGKVWLSYEREALTRGAVGALKGRQELKYFVGSGRRGRTYLFEVQGYWFESPINWYAKKRVWDMAPGHLQDREAPLALPVDSGCLRCHASGVRSALADARNHYAGEPFAAGGIGCASCHGDGSAHVASSGKVRMLDIDGLEPVRRDSVCLSCHLEGQVSVERLGKRMEQFQPGDNLFDYAQFFVYRDEEGSGGRATSQWKALLTSACKRKSGDRMTCTTCHDPHGSPAPEQRVAFYRQKCLACHTGAKFAEKHHAENQDCTACHMARLSSSDIAHEQVTDHSIRKRASEERLPETASGELVSVGGLKTSDRELGLAYAQMAVRGDQAAGARAIELLRKAEKESAAAEGDAALHERLGFLEQVSGDANAAAKEYRLALAADAYDAVAAGDLGLIEARKHNVVEAIQLWKGVVAHDPTATATAMNLSIEECAAGDGGAALMTLDRALEFSPDDTAARDLAEQIRAGNRRCGSR